MAGLSVGVGTPGARRRRSIHRAAPRAGGTCREAPDGGRRRRSGAPRRSHRLQHRIEGGGQPDGSGTYSVILTVPTARRRSRVGACRTRAKSRVPSRSRPSAWAANRAPRRPSRSNLWVTSTPRAPGGLVRRRARRHDPPRSTAGISRAASATGLTSAPNGSAQGSTGGPISGAALSSIAPLR